MRTSNDRRDGYLKHEIIFESLFFINVILCEIIASVCMWISVKFIQDANQLFEEKEKMENKLCG